MLTGMLLQPLTADELHSLYAWLQAGGQLAELDERLTRIKDEVDRQMQAGACGTPGNPHFWSTINGKSICIKCGASGP